MPPGGGGAGRPVQPPTPGWPQKMPPRGRRGSEHGIARPPSRRGFLGGRGRTGLFWVGGCTGGPPPFRGAFFYLLLFFCIVLFCFVLFCFVLLGFVLFCFVLLCFVLFFVCVCVCLFSVFTLFFVF